MKHKILSISLSENFAKEVGLLQREMRFSGRSEMIRTGLRRLISESKEQDKLKGEKECILLVIHNKEAEHDVTLAKHEFDDIISTQIHNNLKGGKCLEVFLLSGPAERIKKMVRSFETNRKIEYAKLIVT